MSPQRPDLLWVNQFAVLPGDGGGTRHFELGRELVKLGWNVTVAASDFHLHKRVYSRRAGPQDRSERAEKVDGVDFLWLWAAPYSRNDWRRAHNWWSFGSSVRAFGSRLKPSLVIGSSPQLLAADAAQRLARTLRVPFVFEVRDLWPESLLAAGGRKGAAYWALEKVASRLYRVSDRVIALASGTVDYLTDRGVPRDKLLLVPNGVDPAAFSPRSTESESANPGASPFTLVYAGAHGPANGLDRVLDAAELLMERGTYRFLLVGDGPAKEQLKRQAKERALTSVDFLDPVPKPELARLFAGCDAGLMVLRDAPLFSFAVSPNKLFDYLAAGLPVVCNVPGEVAGMVEAAGGGVQAQGTSASALADAIETLRHRSPQARTELGQRGREWVVREHGRDVLGARLDKGLRPLLSP